MSSNENPPLPEDARSTAAVPAPRSALLGPVERTWVDEPEFEGPPESRVPAPSGSAYLHALRRHWVLAAALGTLLAILAGLGTYFGWGPRYTATAFFRIAPEEPRLVESQYSRFIESAFEIYKDTQAQLITSTSVIEDALRDSEVANLGIIKREQARGKDEVIWVQENLVVSFPGEAEILALSLTDNDRKGGAEVTKLVNAVVRAYDNGVVNAESAERNQRISDLETACAEKNGEIRDKMNELQWLVKSVGTDDPEALRLKQQIALRRFADVRTLYSQAVISLDRAKGELRAQERLLADVDTIPIPRLDVEEYVNNHPLVRQLSGDLARQMATRAESRQYLSPTASSQYAPSYSDDTSILQAQTDAIRAEAERMFRDKMRAEIATQISRLGSEVEVLQDQEKRLAEAAAKEEGEIAKLAVSSTDLEMKRAEIQRLNDVLTTINAERQRLKVDSQSEPRIRLREPARQPKTEARKGIRISVTIVATIAGFFLPVVCVTWWDTRAQRINSATDVSRGLGLTVLGSIPNIPARAVRQLSSPSMRHHTWHLRLTESIDGIAARLLRQAEVDQTRVILISSAGSGEGKTTLATQLALSLARNGRRTALVDFDLRRPAFDKVLGLPLEPGVSEVLRGQNQAADVVHETGTDNLSVVTAGRWDRNALTALANGAAGLLLDALREQYDFVVVDTAPILPVADTRFVSQHVDAVILSVFRDISRAPKIAAACEILEAFGVTCVEAVVTGPTENLPDKDLKYEAEIPA